MIKKKYLYLMIFLIGTTINSCRPTASPASIDIENAVIYPTPAGTLPEIIDNVSNEDTLVQIVSMQALHKYGPDAVMAVPALIDNLYYARPYNVRRGAAIALGIIGPSAHEAVPELIDLVKTGDTYQTRFSAVEALGRIEDTSAIPVLIDTLYEDKSLSRSITIKCAESVALITGEGFRDAGEAGYTLNDELIPFIVLDARDWWEKEGQFQDWNNE